MKSNRWIVSLLAVIIVTTLILGASLVSPSLVSPSWAQTVGGQICYAIADNDDRDEEDSLVIVNYTTHTATLVGDGSTGSFNSEAIAFHPPSGTLFGVDHDYSGGNGWLGTFDLNTGQFTPFPNVFGSARGSLGNIRIRDIDGLAFDAVTGTLWGSVRRGGADDYDVLVQIDINTGLIIQDAFGTGVDYVVAQPLVGNGDFLDIDDIAVDPLTQVMYAIANDSGERDHLVTVDRTTGIITDLGLLQNGIQDMEGLTFDTTAVMVGTSGDNVPQSSRNSVFEIEKTTASPNLATRFRIADAVPGPYDYEGIDCLTSWTIQTRTPTPTTDKGTVTWTPTATFTSTPTSTFTNTPTATTTSTATASPSPTSTATQPGGGNITITPTWTRTPTATNTPTPTQTPTRMPVAVELVDFSLVREGPAVHLTWETAAEIDNLGFYVYRSADNNFSNAVQVGEFVHARRGVSGAVYSLTDTPGDGIWWYWLVDVDTKGVTTRHGPINTGLGGAAAGRLIYLPFTIGE